MGGWNKAGHVGWLAKNMLAPSAGQNPYSPFSRIPCTMLCMYFSYLPPKEQTHVITPMESQKFLRGKSQVGNRDKTKSHLGENIITHKQRNLALSLGSPPATFTQHITNHSRASHHHTNELLLFAGTDMSLTAAASLSCQYHKTWAHGWISKDTLASIMQSATSSRNITCFSPNFLGLFFAW
jgi:hypothetical protein